MHVKHVHQTHRTSNTYVKHVQYKSVSPGRYMRESLNLDIEFILFKGSDRTYDPSCRRERRIE